MHVILEPRLQPLFDERVDLDARHEMASTLKELFVVRSAVVRAGDEEACTRNSCQVLSTRVGHAVCRTADDPSAVIVFQHEAKFLVPEPRLPENFSDHLLQILAAAALDDLLEKPLPLVGLAGVGADATLEEVHDRLQLIRIGALDDGLEQMLLTIPRQYYP